MPDRRDYPGRGGRARRRSLRRPAGLRAGLLASVLACTLPACGEPVGGAGGVAAPDTGRGYEIARLHPEALRLEGAAKSLEDLLRTVERGLAESDTARLHDLMIDQREYREILFPALPASRPPVNASFETVWVLQYPDSYRGLLRLLERYGGREIRVTAVRFDEPDQDFVNFVLHQTSRVDITVDGEPVENVRLFGSVIRIGDQWKVLTYPDHPDDPS
ncbi:MAG TPA: hypothetical protein VMR66_00905 [Gemmatimonadota bacterium]|nr:hypothetical protein [Gemmatimonadota bacterium]